MKDTDMDQLEERYEVYDLIRQKSTNYEVNAKFISQSLTLCEILQGYVTSLFLISVIFTSSFMCLAICLFSFPRTRVNITHKSLLLIILIRGILPLLTLADYNTCPWDMNNLQMKQYLLSVRVTLSTLFSTMLNTLLVAV